MDLRWHAIIALTLLVALGCSPARRKHDAYQELLDAEKRWLEDQLYQLDHEYSTLKDKQQSLARENQALRQALQEERRGGDGAGRPRSSTSEPSLRVAPDANDIAPPQIELGEPSSPENGLPPITPPSELRQDLPPGAASQVPPEGEELAPPAGELVDPRITHIHLNPLLTGGADLDDKSGDDGVSVVVEPRNAADQFSAVAGPLSIVVLDPAKEGEAARVARWDFSVQETREMMQRSVFGRGIHLQLPWSGVAPENPKLHLFVRYTAPDGAKLEANREIFVELPGHVSNRWTPLAAPDLENPHDIALASHLEPQPGAAEPRPTPAAPPPSKTPPPAGPTVSDKPARPAWAPHR